MLVEFAVKNYRSVKGEQVLSLTKDKGTELAKSHSFQPHAPGSSELLRSAVIYGPNAAGKSNIISAIEAMELVVRTSASSTQEGDEIPVTPFLFDSSASTEPTEFEMTFIADGVKYQFGFSANRNQVLEEWLIAFPKGRAQNWYSRVFDKKSSTYSYKYSDLLIGKKVVWEESTRANALFLSTAVQLNSVQLKPVFNWFKETLRPTSTNSSLSAFTAALCDNEETKPAVMEFLSSADLEFEDINIKRIKFDAKSLPNSIPDAVREDIINDLKDEEYFKVQTIHRTSENKLVQLDLSDESDGTQKLFSLAGSWIDTLSNGCILVVDELNDRLHPKLVSFLVSLFNNSETNPNNAQLIFTTHDTSLLDQELFRRDQIWFCEKNRDKETTLFSLTEFSPRPGRDNLEKRYLSGRYGALPYLQNFDLKAI